MSTDRDITRVVRSWLRTDENESADRVLDAVLDRLDTTPQRRATWWPARRFPEMNNTVRIALAAAAVVAAIVVGVSLFPAQNVGIGPDGTPSPTERPTSTPTPTLTPLPTETALPDFGELAPGTYVIDEPFPLRVSITTDGGWNTWVEVTSSGAAIYQESPDPPGRGVIVATVANVYANPCNPAEGGLVPQLGPSVDDLVAALTSQPRTEASTPEPVTLGGYSGVYVEYTATGPEPGCSGELHRWPSAAGSRQALTTERDQVWILDVDGTRLVIDAFSFGGATEAELAELREVVESIQIDP
jgi:hypothetical protein